eukprot:3889544-Amphidinium_carterae.1
MESVGPDQHAQYKKVITITHRSISTSTQQVHHAKGTCLRPTLRRPSPGSECGSGCCSWPPPCP